MNDFGKLDLFAWTAPKAVKAAMAQECAARAAELAQGAEAAVSGLKTGGWNNDDERRNASSLAKLALGYACHAQAWAEKSHAAYTLMFLYGAARASAQAEVFARIIDNWCPIPDTPELNALAGSAAQEAAERERGRLAALFCE